MNKLREAIRLLIRLADNAEAHGQRVRSGSYEDHEDMSDAANSIAAESSREKDQVALLTMATGYKALADKFQATLERLSKE